MTCPVCGSKTIVVESRSDVETVTRRRKCKECNYIFYTQETECKSTEFQRVLKEYREGRK